MKKHWILSFLLFVVFCLSACEGQKIPPDADITSAQTAAPEPSSAEAETDSTRQPTAPDETKPVTEEQMEQENTLVLRINGNDLNVIWENNETVAELISYAQKEKIVVDTTIYGGFEQVGSLPQSFSRNDVQTTTEPGDIVLYSGNQLVVFFGSNSWSYSMLGHIEGMTQYELSELLGNDSAVVELLIKE